MSARNCSEMQLVANSAKQICLMETKDVNLQVNPNCICHFNISYRLRLLHFKLDKPVSIQTIKHEATRACTQLDTKNRKTDLSACLFFTICYSTTQIISNWLYQSNQENNELQLGWWQNGLKNAYRDPQKWLSVLSLYRCVCKKPRLWKLCAWSYACENASRHPTCTHASFIFLHEWVVSTPLLFAKESKH